MKQCKVGRSGIIVAADVADLKSFRQLMQAVKGITGITGIKIGFLLAMQGLFQAVDIVREELGESADIIYDHQKAGNDIPEMGIPFASSLKQAGVDTAILFPFTGPETQIEWTKACFGEGLEVLTGGIMTHSMFLASEGGYIADGSVLDIYGLAVSLGCRHFVVPGTKIKWVVTIREFLENRLEVDAFSLYAPGFLTQGGDISECGKVAGKSFFPIVGRAIYEKVGVEVQRAAATVIVENFLRQVSDCEVCDE